MQGRHGVIGKSVGAYYEDILRVPLIMRLPGTIKPGTVVDTVTSVTDLMPTILDYAGLPIPEGIHGKNLRPLIEGQKETRYAFSERTSRNRKAMSRMIRGDRWKYVYRNIGPKELFDFENDPQENVNRFEDAECREVVEELHEELRKWLVATQEPNMELFADSPYSG
jgi:arylsulfatase A-like enzyme